MIKMIVLKTETKSIGYVKHAKKTTGQFIKNIINLILFPNFIDHQYFNIFV